MPSLPLTAPERVRIPTGQPPWQAAPAWHIVHVGQSAAILRSAPGGPERRLLGVTSLGRGLVPGGVCLPDEHSFAAVTAALAGSSEGPAEVDFDAWRAIPPDGIFRVDLRIRPAAVDPRAVRRLVALLRADQAGSGAVGDVMDPRPSRALAGPLLRAALAGDGERVTHLLFRLVGAGPGATPAGDDVIVGVLAGLDAAAGSLLSGSAARAARGLLGDRLHPLLGRTTTISRHDLTAAIAGEFAEHVHLLVAALSDPAAAPAAVAAAGNRGATSGVDLATGVAGSLAALVACPTRRRTRPTPEPTPQRSSA